MFTAPPGTLDLAVFREHVAAARSASGPDAALDHWADVLELWRGPAGDSMTSTLFAFRAARDRLTGELGIDPGTALSEAHRRVLTPPSPAGAPSSPTGGASFTKTLGPGWRVGWMVLPGHLVEPVIRLRNRLDVHTSSVTQAIVERLLLDDQLYDRVVRDARALYAERAGVLVDALHAHLPGALEIRPPEGGLFLWPRLADDTVDPAALFRRAVAGGVIYQPGAYFGSPRHLRFSYSDCTNQELLDAVRRLALAFPS